MKEVLQYSPGAARSSSMAFFSGAGRPEVLRLFLRAAEMQAESSGGTVGREDKWSGISDNSMSATEMIVLADFPMSKAFLLYQLPIFYVSGAHKLSY